MNIPVKYMAIAVALLLILAVLAFRKKGHGATRLPLPDDNIFNPLSQSQKEEILKISTALHNNMKGVQWNIFQRSSTPYRDLASASDTIFVGVCEYFNSKLGNGETLRQWMKKETFTDFSADSAWGYVQTIYTRMDAHGIK